MRNVTTMFANKLNRSQESGTSVQRGFSLIELLVVVAIILIIAAIAIASLLNSRIAANEAAAAVTVRTITTASMTYSSAYGNGFPPNLATLGSPSAGPAACSQAVLLDELITTAPNTKSGFIFAFTPVGPLVTRPPAVAHPAVTPIWSPRLLSQRTSPESAAFAATSLAQCTSTRPAPPPPARPPAKRWPLCNSPRKTHSSRARLVPFHPVAAAPLFVSLLSPSKSMVSLSLRHPPPFRLFPSQPPANKSHLLRQRSIAV